MHHAALLQAIDPAKAVDPCSTCGEAIDPNALWATLCGICHKPVCASCVTHAGYVRQSPANEDPDRPTLMEWDVERRDFLIREMKEHAYNLQQAICGRCRQPMPDISQTSIINSADGPVLMCDNPCAAQALGKDTRLEPGSYPTDHIRIVADPRHGLPQDWLNVHFELSLPAHSHEVWSQADCRFAVELSADPNLWDFFAQCDECRLFDRNFQIRPHKWHLTTCYLRRLDHHPEADYAILNAQMLLEQLGLHSETLPGITVHHGDPDCLAYWEIQPPTRF